MTEPTVPASGDDYCLCGANGARHRKSDHIGSMTEPTHADRAKAAEVLHPFGLPLRMSHEELEQLDRTAAALAAERAAAVADLRARVLALAEELANDPDREGDNGGWSDGFTAGMLHASKRLRAAVTDTTGDPA